MIIKLYIYVYIWSPWMNCLQTFVTSAKITWFKKEEEKNGIKKSALLSKMLRKVWCLESCSDLKGCENILVCGGQMLIGSSSTWQPLGPAARLSVIKAMMTHFRVVISVIKSTVILFRVLTKPNEITTTITQWVNFANLMTILEK